MRQAFHDEKVCGLSSCAVVVAEGIPPVPFSPQNPLDEEVLCVLLSHDVVRGSRKMLQTHTDPNIADAFFRSLRVHCSGKSLPELLAEIQYGAFMTPPQPIEGDWDSFIDEHLCFQLKQRWEKVRAAQIQPEVEALMQPALQRLSKSEQTRVNKAFAVLGEQQWSEISVLVAKLAFVQTTVRCDWPSQACGVRHVWRTASFAESSEC